MIFFFFTFSVQHKKRTWENINICVRYTPIKPPLPAGLTNLIQFTISIHATQLPMVMTTRKQKEHAPWQPA